MGEIKREVNEKFHAIAITDAMMEMADAIASAGSRENGVEVEITIRGNKTVTRHFSLENVAELVELLKLNSDGTESKD